MPGQIFDSPMAKIPSMAPVRITYTTSLMGSSMDAVSSLKKDIFFSSNRVHIIKDFIPDKTVRVRG